MKTLITAVLGVLMMGACTPTASAQRFHDDRPRYGHGERPEFGFAPPIGFEVVRSREIVRPCGELCGYRGDDRPYLGVYRIETRFYTEFRRGRVLRTWTEEFEVFLHCYDRYPRRDGRSGWSD